MMARAPFFSSTDTHDGKPVLVDYFSRPEEAEAFASVHGGYVLETTRGRIWRVARQAREG